MNLAIFFCFLVLLLHTQGSQLVPELLLKLSVTLHIQYRYIEHVHEEVSCKKKIPFRKWLLIYNLAILYDMCICGEFNLYHSLCQNNSVLCLHNIDSLDICIKKFDAKKIFFDKITAF